MYFRMCKKRVGLFEAKLPTYRSHEDLTQDAYDTDGTTITQESNCTEISSDLRTLYMP